MTRLTTTSYCLLGLLRLKSFSAYELTKYQQRSALAHLWPRTEAALYREGNRLADTDLVHATIETRGRRERTVYTITPRGIAEFEEWIRLPAGDLAFECEAAVKAFFADAGSLDSLRGHLESLRQSQVDLASMMLPATSDWLDDRVEFPDRIHYTAMAADLIARINAATKAWADEWLEQTANWDDTGPNPDRTRQAHAIIAGLREQAQSTIGH